MTIETRTLPDDAVLIVGAGLAGLFLALNLKNRRAIVLSPSPLGQSAASAWAQGGLAAALDPEDNPDLHAHDTIVAGAGLVDPVVAQILAREGPARVHDLLAMGVPFDKSSNGSLALSLEAAHSRPRVARVKGDLAGKAIMDALIAAVRGHDRINLIEGLRMESLLQGDDGAIGGVLTRDARGALVALAARETVLAVGGAGGLYQVTTNPGAAEGVALAVALKAHAAIADPEFVQFHPTAIDIGLDPAPLATEALRGDGAILVNADGAPFMTRYHAQGELAPRDVVARAIHSERESGRGALLDCTNAVGAHFPEHFPTVFGACMKAGIDPRSQPIPVAPAAHYHMGGVLTDMWGKTALPGLSAVGECASTGAHGANRLASNSLLEAVVFAHRIAQRLDADHPAQCAAPHAAPAPPLTPETRRSLREIMQSFVGVMRDREGLARACENIAALRATHGDANALISAHAIAKAALTREESRGGHFRSDFPAPREPAKRTFIHDLDATP
jgi:L-aspartate oxidase